MPDQIQLRRDTAANWTSTNPILAQAEAGLETDTGKLKFGDGTTAWTSLTYFTGGGVVDHGADLVGLADDDHTQYLLADGSRAMSGSLDMGTLAITNVGNVDGRDVSADGTKLDGIEAGATADQTPAEILADLLTVDGSGSLLDADKLDNKEATEFLLTTGAQSGATAGPQSFGVNGITADRFADSSGGGIAVADDFVRNSDSSTIHALETAFNANDIYRTNSASDSDFVSTIATLPGGATLTYGTVSSGDAINLVPTSTSQIAKMVLHNTTRGDNALISNCVTGTSTITLTAAVPGTWQVGDAITIRSQTCTGLAVGGGGAAYYADFELSGLNSDTDYFVFYVAYRDTGAAGKVLLFHPYEAQVSSKALAIYAQVANILRDAISISPVISNRFCAAWSASGTGTVLWLARLVGEGRKTS